MKKAKGVLIAVLFVAVFVFCSKYETTDKKMGKVIDTKGFVVIVEDEHGFRWNWNTEKSFTKNEDVIIYIDNKGTFKNVNDDTVKRVKKVR